MQNTFMKNTFLFVIAASGLGTPAMAEEYTNIVLIHLDDVGNIDRLDSEGVRFTHFIAGQPISGTPLPQHKIDGVSILPLIERGKEANPRKCELHDLRRAPGERYNVQNRYPEIAPD